MKENLRRIRRRPVSLLITWRRIVAFILLMEFCFSKVITSFCLAWPAVMVCMHLCFHSYNLHEVVPQVIVGTSRIKIIIIPQSQSSSLAFSLAEKISALMNTMQLYANAMLSLLGKKRKNEDTGDTTVPTRV